MATNAICVRIPDSLQWKLRVLVERRRGRGVFPAHYSITDFIIEALREKFDHIERSSRKSSKKRPCAAVKD